MSSKRKNYEHKSRMSQYVQKINLNNTNRKTRKKPPKLCPECKETNNCVKTFAGKINKIEEVVDNYYKNTPKKNTVKFSMFNAKFTINEVPCEIEYDLSCFTFDELQNLVKLTTNDFNKNKISNKND
ncbi:8402_t:CDS:1 [Funneliformis geosporum]|uniref:15712_t:CDS:1 n=1 Tax=Funneliformis geosporum TaxID=1117311 RepID=A0A9W4WWA6_9GLOM|nr:8402_t:CDS:1 [Funneliformis geosporum]CAI2168397.1 15712_t:CDS:1 [Funneliformis geosporum]